MNIRDFKIGNRLLIVFAVIATMSIASSVYFLFNLNRIKDLNSMLFDKNLKAIDFLLEADRDSYQSRLAISHSLQKKSGTEFENYKKEIKENLEQVNTRYSKYSEIYNIQSNNQLLTTDSVFKSNYKTLVFVTDSIIKQIEKNNQETANNLYNNQYKSAFDTMRESMNKATEILLENADKEHQEVIKIAANIFMIILITSVIYLVIIILSGIVTTRSIVRPLSLLVTYSKKLSDGDLGIEIEQKGKDEVSKVFDAYKEMITKLKDVIDCIRNNATELVSASTSIAATSESIAQGANEQATSTEEIAASIEEIAGSVNQNSGNAQETEKIALKAAKSIEKGKNTMTKLVADMKEVEEKSTVINEIAQKTDLLAINAAIEAARAGKYGKGFAIVASEVRGLAVTSQKAASTIYELIKQNVHNVKEFNELIADIYTDVQKTAQLVQEISATSLEQNSGITQISNAIQQLNSTTQENSANSEELSASASQLESQAGNLKQAINYFVINQKDVIEKIAEMRNHMNYLMTAIDNLENNHNINELSKKVGNPPPQHPIVKKTNESGIKYDMHNDDSDYDKY